MYFYLHMNENMIFPAFIFTKLHTDYHVAIPSIEFRPQPIFMELIFAQDFYISY